MTKKKIIELISHHLQLATTTKDYYFEKYKRAFFKNPKETNDELFTQCITWRTVCETLEGILRRIK